MALAITGVSPTSGSTLGGTTVYITGTDLDTVTGVTFGGTAATAYEIEGETLIQAVTPAHAAGAVDVVLTDGETPVTLAGGYTYAAPSSTEVLTSTLARKMRVDVNTGTSESPSWTQVRAITTMQTAITPTMQDDSDYDSDGWGSQAKTMLAWSLTMTVARKVGVSSGDYDPGQERLRQAHDKFGAEGVVEVRWYDRNGGAEAYSGFAHVSWEPQGGATDALDTVNVTLTGQGARETIVNPAA